VAQLSLGAIYFLRNVLSNYKIGELTSFLVTVFTLNAYLTIRMSTTGYHIYQKESNISTTLSNADLLEILQLAMIVFGMLGVFFSCTLFLVITPIIFEETKENIFMHLDGNIMLFDNFLQVT